MAATGLGALVGHLIAPGLGGALLGGLVGHLADRATVAQKEKKTVYCAFDFEHDRDRKILLIGQSKHPKSPFEVHDKSLIEAAPERDWQRFARAAIQQCDLVVVLLGQHTHRAPGVLVEVQLARSLGVPTIQLRQSWDRTSRRVAGAGRLVDWTWENLERELS